MKLIILNGPPGAGKSTLSEMLALDHPMSVVIDIDVIRRTISGYKDHREESSILSFSLAYGMCERALKDGHDVIIDKTMYNRQIHCSVDDFASLAQKYGASIHEFILTANKETLVERVIARGLASDSLLTLERVEMHAELINVLIAERKDATVIDTTGKSPEDTYAETLLTLKT